MILRLPLFLTVLQGSAMQSRRKDPRTARSGGASRMLRGLMLRRRAVLGTRTKMRKICWSPGLRPGPRWGSLQRSPRPLGELTALPQAPGGAYSAPPGPLSGGERGLCCPLPKNPTYNIVIVLVLCVCTHVYEKCTVIFS